MTDYSLVENELKMLLDCDDVNGFESYIYNAISCVAPMLENEEAENDTRVVHLCAVKAYYMLTLAQNSQDDIVSFKAGDVSYQRDTSSLPNVKALYDMALIDCAPLMNCSSFEFRAV